MSEGEQGEKVKPTLSEKAINLADSMGYGVQARAVVEFYESHRNEVAGMMMAGTGINIPGVPEGSPLDNFIKGAEKMVADGAHFAFPNRIGLTTFIGGLVGGLGLGAAETVVAASNGKKGPGIIAVAANFILAGAIANHFENPAGGL